MARFRNLLVHLYARLDDGEVGFGRCDRADDVGAHSPPPGQEAARGVGIQHLRFVGVAPPPFGRSTLTLTLRGEIPVKCLQAVFVAVALVASTAVLASAQTETAPDAKQNKTTEKAGEVKQDLKAMVARTANGTVRAASADKVVVAGTDKGRETEWTFAVDAKTKVKKRGKDVSAAELSPGDPVHVRYMEHEGKARAESINVPRRK